MLHDSMMSRMTVFMSALAVFGLALIAQPAWADPPRAVIELFTSQGCSSCPPADAVLSELSRRPDTIALSFPVDYWDYLGWKDTLAQAAFTARQKTYAQARDDRQIYTPQVVVNGVKSCVGSDRAQIEQLIQTSTGGLSALPIGITAHEHDGILTILVSENTGSVTPQKAGIWFLPVLRSQAVAIGRGENRGRTITYVNVVRGLNRLGDWKGGTARFDLPLNQALEGADGYVVLVQAMENAGPGMILGAAKGPGL